MNDLLQQAIADAKAIKKVAIENAKATLAETFEPQIKSMIQQRLMEESDDLYEGDMDEDSTYNEAYGEDEEMQEEGVDLDSIIEELQSELYEEGVDDYHDVLLEELEEEVKAENLQLVEDITALEELRDQLYEEMEEEEMEEEEIEEGRKKKEDDEDEEIEMEDEGMEGGEMDVEEMSKKELLDYIHQLQSQIDQLESQGGEEVDMDMDMDMDMEEPEMPSEEEVKEAVEAVLNSMHPREVQALEEAVLGPVKPMRRMNESSRIRRPVQRHTSNSRVQTSSNPREVDNLRTKLRESYKTVNNLQSTLNEVSLINSKLLYTGKLFRAYNNLSEQNKVAILEFFDRVNTLEEVKQLYGKFNKALQKKTSALTEGSDRKQLPSTGTHSRKTNTRLLSESTASKSTGFSTKPTKILEEDKIIARWQELAGITTK